MKSQHLGGKSYYYELCSSYCMKGVWVFTTFTAFACNIHLGCENYPDSGKKNEEQYKQMYMTKRQTETECLKSGVLEISHKNCEQFVGKTSLSDSYSNICTSLSLSLALT